MPITSSPYQMKFDLDLPEEDPNSALSADEVQLRKDLARAFIENPETWPKNDAGKPEKPYWFDRYVTLSEGRWPFRVAVLIAWLGTPKKYRWPKTQDELADVLGMSSDRQFSVWMARNPQIKSMAHAAWKDKVLDGLSDSIDAMLEVAARSDYKSKGDRELHFKVAEILSDKVIVDDRGKVDLSKLPFDEKLRLAGLDSPEAVQRFRDELAAKRSTAEDQSEDNGDVDVPSVS